MNFNKFLEELEFRLYFFDKEEIDQIIIDYKDIYNSKIMEGKLEQQILAEFDTPKEIAEKYIEELDIQDNLIKKYYINFKKRFIINRKQKKIEYNSIWLKKLLSKFKNMVKKLIQLILIGFGILLILGYLCSLIFIDINVYTFNLRLLETLFFIASLTCIYLALSWLRKDSNE